MSPLGFKARVGSLIHAWSRHMCYMFPEILRVTPADLLAVSMAAKPFSSTYMRAGIGEARNRVEVIIRQHGSNPCFHLSKLKVDIT